MLSYRQPGRAARVSGRDDFKGRNERQEEMKGQNNQQRPPLSTPIVEDDAPEKLKKRLQDLGLIINAGGDKPAKPTGKKKDSKK